MPLQPDEIAFLQYEDELTGLNNRRYLLKHLETNVPWASPKGPVSLLLIDLDGFKGLNERLGQAAADGLLVAFADRLRATAGPDDFLCRYGGDSFLAVLPNTDKARAAEVGERLRSSLESAPLPPAEGQAAVALTFSGAVATFPEDGAGPDGLLDAADRALYVSKHSGRNRISIAGRLDESIAAPRDAFATLPCPLFVGREAELQTAVAALEELRQKRPFLLFLQGGPGAGKSRFLREYARRARDAGLLYLHVTCSDAKRLVPAHALLYLIDRYYAKHPDAHDHLRSKLSAPQRAVIRDLVPVFAGWKAETVVPSERDRKLLVLQAVESAVRAMAEQAPVLILLDNAGSIDRGTLDILRIIVRDRRTSIGVIFAFKGDLRSVDPKRDAALLEFVTEFDKAQRMQTIPLPPLAAADLERMVGAILPGAELPPAFASTIAEAAQGNPLYAEEAIRSLILRDRIRKRREGWSVSAVSRGELPPSLDAVILSVLNQLPEGAGEILTNAAVIGSQFDVQTLQEVMGHREGQAMDAVDRSRAAGLIRRSADGPPDDFEFSAGHARDVRYDSADEEGRRAAHRRVSDVLKVRHVRRPDLAAGEIAYHDARAEGADPFAADAAEAEAARTARIPEATVALSPEGLKRAIEFMRALAGLLKTQRLYPQWNQMAEGFKGTLGMALKALLMESRTLTFSADPQGLKVNRQPLEPARAGEAAAEFQELLSSRLIGSLTIAHGIDGREIDALLAALAAPMDRSTAPADHWDRFLDREHAAHLDILQRRYLARQGETIFLRKGGKVEERPLDAGEIELLWPAVRFLKAAVDNLRLYPPGHALVEGAMADAARAFEALLSRVRVVTFSAPEGSLLVNSAPVDAKTAADAAVFLAEEFAKKEMTSLTLSAGLAPDEVRAVASALSVADGATAGTILSHGDVRHAAANLRSYARVAAGETDATGETPGAAAAPPPPEPKLRLDLRARGWLKAPVERFLGELSESEFALTLQALNFGAFMPLADQLIDRLGAVLSDPTPEHRRRAALKATRLVAETEGDVRTLVLTRLREPLQKAVLAEKEGDILYVLGQAAQAWITHTYTPAKLAVVADFLWKAVKPRLDRDETPREFRASLGTRVQGLATAKAQNHALDALKAGPAPQRMAGVQILALGGPAMAATFADLVTSSENAEIRAAAAAGLKLIGPAGFAELARAVRADGLPGPVSRALSVLEQAGSGNVATPVFTALDHADPAVREAALALVKRIDRSTAAAILRKALAKDDAAFRASLLQQAGLMKIGELAADAAELALGTKDDHLAQAACAYMAKFPSPKAMEALWRIFDQKSKMFGLVKGFSDETRAAAVSAAARINHPESGTMIEEAKGDKSPVVRAAVPK